MRRHLNALPILLAFVASCTTYRPARFASSPPVVEIADDRPIPLPPRLEPVPEMLLTDTYVRRPIVAALDPTRIADAGDVNAFDDVPRSSWFDPRLAEASFASLDGPPVPPLKVLDATPDSSDDGLRVTDARGIRYEIVRDPVDRPGLRSGAAAAASRLLRALGYFTADAWALEVQATELDAAAGSPAAVELQRFLRGDPRPAPTKKKGDALTTTTRGATAQKVPPRAPDARVRVSAVRWPVGIDVGPTPAVDARTDDPNDRVPHIERRTLRTLKLALYWLGMAHLSPRALRDAYVGPPGKGYLRHYIVGMHSAFGAGHVVRDDTADADFEGKNALVTLGTLGLAPQRRPAVQTTWPALGHFPEDESFTSFAPRPPFEPSDYLLPSDAYWMAKRLAAVTDERVNEALDAAKMGDPAARAQAKKVLDARRMKAIAWAFAAVTPCEVTSLARDRILLRDEAIARGTAEAEGSLYAVTYVDHDGGEVAPGVILEGNGTAVTVPVPQFDEDYVVVRIFAVRGKKRAPRAFEAHLERSAAGPRLLGVRH